MSRDMLQNFHLIKSIRHRGLKRLYERGDRSRLPPDMVDRIEGLLAVLDTAKFPEELDRPSLRLHPLSGDRKGQWAVTVRANWRITFTFEDGHVRNVDFVDYH